MSFMQGFQLWEDLRMTLVKMCISNIRARKIVLESDLGVNVREHRQDWQFRHLLCFQKYPPINPEISYKPTSSVN